VISAESPVAVSPTVSVIICVYSELRWNDIVAAVRSIAAQDTPALETIIVVDHNPALLQRVRTELDGVVVGENTEARGLSGARNCGVALARGDIVAFLDDDAWAEPDWLRGILAGYDDDPLVIGVGGGIEPAWSRPRPRWWPVEFDWVIGCSYRGLPTEPAEVRNMIGANMSFRRATLQAAGPFSHGLGRIGTRPLGGEETELSIRARRTTPGSRILYVPAALVHHRVPASRGTIRYYASRCYSEGLSKAAVASLVGADRALASERTYVTSVLGAGAIRHSLELVRHRDPAGPLRAAAIALGLGATTLGYVVGYLAQARKRRRSRA
jgi:glucosyl-dolichyl phosphate glucuronosyltransferase